MVNCLSSYSQTFELEYYIRLALETGELSPGMEASIQRAIACNQLTPRDAKLLQLLKDAINDGCIRRIHHSMPTQYE